MWTASTGLANGTFYWGYFLFEVPSNVIMEKVGARLWIARIMITRGLLAGATALVTGSSSYGVGRGAAERRQIGDDHVARLHHCDIRAENRKPKVGLRHCREVRDGVVERRLSGDTVACAYLDLL